jgi:hypothetical protein
LDWIEFDAGLPFGLDGPGPHFVGMGRTTTQLYLNASVSQLQRPRFVCLCPAESTRIAGDLKAAAAAAVRSGHPCPRGFTASEPYHEVRGLVPEDLGGRGLHRWRHGALHDPHQLLYASRSPQSPPLHLSIQPSLF